MSAPKGSRSEVGSQPKGKLATIEDDEPPRQPTNNEESKTKGFNVELTLRFVNKSLTRGVKDIVAEFRDERRGNDLTRMTVFTENQQFGRNRYKDVGCLDETRVPLTLGPVNYIHANYVNGHRKPKRFICTQAPVDKTIQDFWHMVVQEKCKFILMLCNFREQGADKCVQYFPRTVAKALDFGGISVNALKVGKQKFICSTKNVVVRSELSVIVPGRRPHRCIHLWWRDWPDRGVPQVDMAPVELCARLELNSKNTPIVVHCSAGIGRTGSIVLIDLLLEMLRVGTLWEETLVKYLRNLRAQRNNSIQTDHQYLYVHQVMLNYAINHFKLGKKDPKLALAMDKFTAEYNSYCNGFQT